MTRPDLVAAIIIKPEWELYSVALSVTSPSLTSPPHHHNPLSKLLFLAQAVFYLVLWWMLWSNSAANHLNRVSEGNIICRLCPQCQDSLVNKAVYLYWAFNNNNCIIMFSGLRKKQVCGFRVFFFMILCCFLSLNSSILPSSCGCVTGLWPHPFIFFIKASNSSKLISPSLFTSISLNMTSMGKACDFNKEWEFHKYYTILLINSDSAFDIFKFAVSVNNFYASASSVRISVFSFFEFCFSFTLWYMASLVLSQCSCINAKHTCLNIISI